MTHTDKEKNWKEPHEFAQTPVAARQGECVCGNLRESPLHTNKEKKCCDKCREVTHSIPGRMIWSCYKSDCECHTTASDRTYHSGTFTVSDRTLGCACGGVMTHPKTVHTASGCVVEPTEVGESWARNFSKNANAYIAFFQGCREGKRVIYAMPEGEIYSPAKHAEIVAEARQRAYEEGMQNKWTAELDIVRKVAFEAGKQMMREELREKIDGMVIDLADPRNIVPQIIAEGTNAQYEVEGRNRALHEILDLLKDTGSSK